VIAVIALPKEDVTLNEVAQSIHGQISCGVTIATFVAGDVPMTERAEKKLRGARSAKINNEIASDSELVECRLDRPPFLPPCHGAAH